jgi:Tfp pilus assembly protein PilZ
MRILKARFRSGRDFLEAYNADLPTGGLFCPTTYALEENQEVVAEIHFPGLPNKMLLRGTVVWWRTALPRLRVRAGAMVAILDAERDKRDFVLEVASGRRQEGIKRRHPRIPVEMHVRWRPADSPLLRESELHEISVGGALLVTDEPLAVGDEIVVEFTTPGGAQPIAVAGKITYHSSAGNGVRFIYRDGGGSQRLREVVRRLIASASSRLVSND